MGILHILIIKQTTGICNELLEHPIDLFILIMWFLRKQFFKVSLAQTLFIVTKFCR